MNLIKFLMAFSYLSNDLQSNDPRKCYKTSSITPAVIYGFYFDAFILFTYPFFSVIYNYVFNFGIFCIMQLFCIIILPFFLRWLVTQNDLTKYIERHDEKKIKLYGNLLWWMCLPILFFSVYVYAHWHTVYVEGVVK
jgi:hypothetical protein